MPFSLNHDYANVNLHGGVRPEAAGEQERRAGQAQRDQIRTTLRDFVTVKMRKEGSGPEVSHVRQGSGDSQAQPLHPRQSSGDSTEKSSDFLDAQMAKLLERKGHSRDETDSGLQVHPDTSSMRRSKSGDIPRGHGPRPHSGEMTRPGDLALGRSVSGDLAARNPEILDEDAKKMLKDCQDYLLGAFDLAEGSQLGGGGQTSEDSPRGGLGRGARSLHSSPGNSYSKYSGSTSHLNRSHSGQLNLSPPSTIQKPVSSPTGNSQRSFCPKTEMSPREEGGKMGRPGEDRISLHSDVSETSKQSPHNETGPSSLEEPPGAEYQNVDRRVEAQARGKLREAANVRNRERRNSFRQAVDTKAAQVSLTSLFEMLRLLKLS